MSEAPEQAEVRIRPLGTAALIAVAGAALVVGWGAWRLTEAALAASAAGGQMETADARGPDLARAQAQIDGRSLFFIPSAPPPPAPPPRTSSDDPPPAPPPPPPPTRYGGPDIIALINDAVWLKGGDILGLDESADGVTVLAVNAPWSARLLWRDVEFDVSLFGRDEVVYPGGLEYEGQEAPPSSSEAELQEASQNGAEPAPDDGTDQSDDRAASGDPGEEAEGTGR